METEDENMSTLLSMGFQDLREMSRALRLAKNDLNEAVAILTNDQPQPPANYPMDFDVNPVAKPPSYSQVIATEKYDYGKEEVGGTMEFPATNLYELESRVFTDSWSIPYKREESLGKCLLAATRLAQEGLWEADDNCKHFLDRCMPEAFKKLLTSGAVRRWGPEIQEGIFTMVELLVDLVVARLKHDPVPETLLDNTLAIAFNPECEWNSKNKQRRWNILHWENCFGSGKTYATSPQASSFKEPCGWLVDLVNRFAEKGGFELIQKKFTDSTLTASSMAALLLPLGHCAEYLNTNVVCPILSPCMDVAVHHVRSLQDCDLKRYKIVGVSNLLLAMKMLCTHLWTNLVELMNSLRLEIILRLLRSLHFDSRMNGLNEVVKLIDEANGLRNSKIAIEPEKLLEWLVESKVLSIALEGNIDHVQYTDRIKTIVEFLGPRLSTDELTKIWKMQEDQNNQVVDNIYAIMAAASVKFNAQQFDHLFTLIQKNWQEENVGMREKLLTLIGKIGREARPEKTSTKVLDLLWDLAHLPSLATHLVEQALEEHMKIINDPAFKDQVRKSYIIKCVEDIKKSCCVLPALKQLHGMAQNIAKPGVHKQDKAALSDLNKTHEVIKLITVSLRLCHKMAANLVADKQLCADTIVDGRYSHGEYVNCHLSFLQFMLQEGDLYLPWNRCKDIWDTLVANSEACDFDREVCFDWFGHCLEDLEVDTRSQLFQQKLLKLDPAQVTLIAFHCIKTYFETVNSDDRKLRKATNSVVVEKLDLTGIDYFWQVVLYAHDEEIADTASNNILDFSYLSLAPRLKKDTVALHKKFINDCYKRLEGYFRSTEKVERCASPEAAMMTLSGSAMSTAVSSATKTLTAMSVAEVASLPLPSRSAQLQNVRRILMIAERYVSTIEEMHTAPRTILPHGAAFQGHPITMHVTTCEGTKQEFTLVGHSNETLWSIRQKIALQLKTHSDQIQILANDRILMKNCDQKLIGQLDFDDEYYLVIKINNNVSSSSAEASHLASQTKEIQDSLDETESCYGGASLPPIACATPTSNRLSFNFEQEKMLPGVVMSMGGQVFDMLYQLAELDDPKIMARVKNLLRLIPTDPSIQDVLDSLGSKELTRISPPVEASPSPRASPRSSPKKINVCRTHDNPLELLKGLFDAQNMPPFRVLYNLEVLSSKLMPTSLDVGMQHSARVFRDEFLNIGGLNLVINILQKDALPAEVDYDTRQGCYFTALQLARFLLCGQSVTGIEVPPSPVIKLNPTKKIVHELFTLPSPASLKVLSAASKAIQTMGVTDFTDTLLCLMRVAWAAAAGRLHLANAIHPARESGAYLAGPGRSRQSSTGSNASSGSSEGEAQSLHAGVCAQQTHVSSRDSLIGREALELLVTCLQLRSHLISSFYTLNCVGDFIIDTLLGSPSSEIRSKACEQFYQLSQLSAGVDGVPSPHHFLLQVLLKAHLPLWVPSSNARGASQRLLSQCSQYFELRCRLLQGLKASELQCFHLKPEQMLDDEIAWLNNFTTSEHPGLQATDSALLAGHLRLVQTLLTCEEIDKQHFGTTLISDLLNRFLFPASHLISQGLQNTSSSPDNVLNFNPKCFAVDSRVAAYDLLVELATDCPENMECIIKQLIHLHHKFNPDLAREFEYEPAVAGRADCGYVGLKNAGATCYMNSVIQQLFMVPGVREAVLAVDEEEDDDDNVFHQFQAVFGHLLESRLQYYTPARFWRCFKLWGQPVNVREQQDAFEFFMHLVDQVDEHLKHEPLLKPTFEGLFSNQMICQDCPHRYEREETFMALNVTVKSHSLQDSLDQFVRGELLEGENAYYCEKCDEKRNTIKRTCIKALPPVLVIHLKRFDYDWEANRALKFDDHFKFPWLLDMVPYTADGIQAKEQLSKCEASGVINSSSPLPGPVPGPPRLNSGNGNSSSAASGVLYQLVGVIVHSGQANAGHYYSFIKDRRGDSVSNPNRGKWFKFNDISVEQFDMNDATLENECFGGMYRAKVYDPTSSYPEFRQRYWNGYMLFYEKLEDLVKMPRALKSVHTRRSFRKLEHEEHPSPSPTAGIPQKASLSRDSDGLTQLTELVHHGDQQGIFRDKIPARIQQTIREENLRFMQNRDVHSEEYFSFIHRLATCNRGKLKQLEHGKLTVFSLQLGVNFLFNTYFRTKKKEISVMNMWVDTLESLLSSSSETVAWLLDCLASESGFAYIKPFLLECPNKEVRNSFGHLMKKLFESCTKGNKEYKPASLDKVLGYLLEMLIKDVPDNCRSCVQYFYLLSSYAQMGTEACEHLFKHNAFSRLLEFLLGPLPLHVYNPEEVLPRRWSSAQAREFIGLHTALALLILSCDMAPYRSCNPGTCSERASTWAFSPPLPMPMEVQTAILGDQSLRYVKEVVTACREVSGSLAAITDMLAHCSFCNQNFSEVLLKEIMFQYSSVSSNELKHLLQVLLDLLTMEDAFQFSRLQNVIDGYTDKSGVEHKGMLTVIRSHQVSDSRRSYQCIKFLVHLANKSNLAKDYLMQTPSKWQWAVSWLRKKMSEHSYWTPQSMPLSNEDSNSRSFQRTVSAQDTLAEATALLTEAESPDHKDIDMDNSDADQVVDQGEGQEILQKMDDLESIDS